MRLFALLLVLLSAPAPSPSWPKIPLLATSREHRLQRIERARPDVPKTTPSTDSARAPPALQQHERIAAADPVAVDAEDDRARRKPMPNAAQVKRSRSSAPETGKNKAEIVVTKKP
jgi:hypothetical protein